MTRDEYSKADAERAIAEAREVVDEAVHVIEPDAT